jgi:hypothetical protein
MTGGRAAALALPLAVFTTTTAYLTWPLASGLADHLVAETPLLLADVLALVWMQTWTTRALVSAPLALFDANAFHPTPRSLAGCEHLLGNTPVFAPVWLASGNPVLGFNAVTFASFVLGGVFMYALVKRWTGSAVAGYVAGLAFAFAPWRFELGRPRSLPVQYLPLIVLGLERTAATASLRAALVTAGVLTLQILCSYYVGYVAAAAVGGWLVAEALVGGVRGRGAAWRSLGVAVLSPLAIVVPVTLPYIVRERSGELVYAPPPGADALARELVGFVSVTRAYVGWGALVFGVGAFLALWRPWSGDRARGVRVSGLALVALAGYVLARGRAGLGVPALAPFGWLAAVVPGLAHFRAPVLFGALAGFSLSALAGLGVARGLAAVRGAGGGAIVRGALGVAAIAAVLWPASLRSGLHAWPVATGRDLPPAYRWLAAHGDGGPLLEVPIGPALGLAHRYAAARAMYFSTYHWLPLLNGHTGYPPPSYAVVEELGARLPATDALRELVDCAGLRWVLAHGLPPATAALWQAQGGLRLRETFPPVVEGSSRLYEVVLAPRPPAARACTRWR